MKQARIALAAVALLLLALVVVGLLRDPADEPARAAPSTAATRTASAPRPGAPGPAAAAPAAVTTAPAAEVAAEVSAVVAEAGVETAAAPDAVWAQDLTADPAKAWMSGVVRSPDGGGLPGAVVALEVLNEEALGQMPAAMRKMMLEQSRKHGGDDGWFVQVGHTTTDAQGRFHLAEPQKAGDPARLRVWHARHLPAKSREFPRASPPAVDVALVGGGTLVIHLRTVDGAAPEQPMAWVTVEEKDRPAIRSTGLAFEYDLTRGTYAAGFTPRQDGPGQQGVVAAVPAGHHTVQASANGYGSASAQVAIGDGVTTTVELVLPAGLTLAGKVVDGSGAPVANASISAYPMKLAMQGWGGGGGQGMRPLHTQSAQDGAFALRGLEQEGYMVQAWAEGYQSPQEMPRSYEPGGDPIVLTLSKLRTISGRVVLEGTQESAGPGISVDVDALDGGMAWGGGMEQGVQTGEDGAFSAQVGQGNRFALTARGKGLTTGDRLEVRLPAQGDLTGVVVSVRKGAGLTLTAVDRRSRRPVEGAAVSLTGSAPGASMAAGWGQQDEEGKTDAQGRLRLEGLAPGEWTASVNHPEYATGRHTVVVKGSEPDPVVVELAPAARLRLRLLDASGAPMAGHMVMLMPRGAGMFSMAGGPEHMGSADDDGRCELAPVAAGTYTVQGMNPSGMGSSMLPLGDVTVAEGQTLDVELRAGGKGKVRGQVLRGSRPLPSAPVVVRGASGDWLSGYAWIMTDAEGRFEADVVPGKLLVSTGGATERPVDVGAGATVEVVLEVRAGTVAGRLTGPDGAPVRGARVLLRRVDASDDLAAEAADWQALWTERPTDELGRFQHERVRPGRYRPVASVAGLGAVIGDELTIGEDDARTGLELMLSPGARLELTLQRADGSPATGATVMLYHLGLRLPDMLLNGWANASRTADGQGRVIVEDALPGEYAVLAGSEASGMALAERLGAAPGSVAPLALPLRPPGTVVVAAAPGTVVTLHLESGAPANPVLSMMPLAVDASGEVSIPHLPAGHTYQVRGKAADGRALATASAAPPEGGSVRVELR